MPAEPGGRARFPIVGVGASAGGLEAFTQLLRGLPLDTWMGFILVQPLDPEHESALTQILAPHRSRYTSRDPGPALRKGAGPYFNELVDHGTRAAGDGQT